ncbi:reprolysin-like metallopeptidase [Wocania ichthyoenteri]|uniref:reprolysin-like metallopeptidase n=1 Tax=Wocania ichthyoenteri TaxID=1230531 RepID=UPI00053D9C1C|nr:zinc-dependent metalloprotease family protein [Wocania ichthyoenteri]
MKYFYIKNYLYLLLFSFFLTSLSAQNNKAFWTKVTNEEASIGKKGIRKTEPLKSVYYQLDINKLKTALSSAPKRSVKNEVSNLIIQIPNSEGHFDNFEVKESSVLEPDYQEKYPELRTYIGQNIKNPSSIISFSVTPKGFHGMVLSSKTGTQFIDPYTQNNTYIVYNKGDLPRLKEAFKCYLPDDATVAREISKKSKSFKNANDSKLRTFRLALASTIEYSKYHWEAAGLTDGDTEAAKKAAVLAAMVVTMNRVNSIFQRDLAIKMTLVDNSSIIFIDTDNFTNNDANQLIDESQSEINSIIGAANYDIGHTFSTGGGGLASLNSPCVDNRKASGITGSSNPVGDAYDIDYVAHEMGHQFGAPHTFNGNASNCSGGNRTASNAYEPGSGTTIMAYAGICSPQNVQLQSDTYFHQKSIQMIWDNITTGLSTCGTETILTNNAPVANAGPDYTIPISTAYKLVGSSTDPDGTTGHTYTWEQYDLGSSGIPEETNTAGPLVRSFEGTTEPIRNIPSFLDYLITNGSTTWEKLPSVNRTLNFALTVRDNDVMGTNGGGQTDVDFVQIFINSTDPFAVINPISWTQGTTQTIEWVVGQSANVATINCQSVDIKLSTDGGATFPTVIASNTPNDGAFSYVVPAIADTSTARILIEAADNIFYDISDFEFTISANPDFFIANETLAPISCDDVTATYTFDYVTANGFSENTTFSASGNPGASTVSFSPTSRTTSGPVTMTISNLDAVSQNNYTLTITGTPTVSSSKNKNVAFPFFNSNCVSIANIDYATSSTLVEFNTISNATGKGDDGSNPLIDGYSDYTSITTDVNRNSSYDLTVNVNTDGGFGTTTKVWVDWNQNCSFDDVGEEYNLGDALNVIDGATGNSPLSVTIPPDAILGSTLMRVSTKFEGDFGGEVPTACENGFDGEVEDYTINVQASLAVEEFGFENFTVFPNPNKGEFTIKLNSSLSSNINVGVYDLRGRAIYKNKYKDAGDFNEKINLNHVQSGMYILTVKDDKRKSTKKIIIE